MIAQYLATVAYSMGVRRILWRGGQRFKLLERGLTRVPKATECMCHSRRLLAQLVFLATIQRANSAFEGI